MHAYAKSLWSCLTLFNSMDCSPLAFSVPWILQARLLQCVAMPSSRDLPDPRIEPTSPVTPALQVVLSHWGNPLGLLLVLINTQEGLSTMPNIYLGLSCSHFYPTSETSQDAWHTILLWITQQSCEVEVILSPFYRWGNWSSWKSGHTTCRNLSSTRTAWLQSSCS